MSIPKSYNTTITILFAIACFACSPGQIVSDGETGFGTEGESDAGDSGKLWAETTCRQLDNLVICFGRPVGSVDAWVLVAQECTFDALQANGFWDPLMAWHDDSCADGEAPTGFWPDKRCGLLGGQGSVCMMGGEGWLTQAIPECELTWPSEQAWSGWLCDGAAGNVGAHPWDSIMCSPDDLVTCIAVDDGTGQATWPTCWVYQWPEAKAPDC